MSSVHFVGHIVQIKICWDFEFCQAGCTHKYSLKSYYNVKFDAKPSSVRQGVAINSYRINGESLVETKNFIIDIKSDAREIWSITCCDPHHICPWKNTQMSSRE